MPRKKSDPTTPPDGPAPFEGTTLATTEAATSNGLVTRLATRRGAVVPGKQEVKKHVAAIHTSGELGLLERKLVNILLLNAYDDLATARQHRLPTKLLMAMLGWTESDDTVLLKKALTRIVSTTVEFDLLEPNDEFAKKTRWMTTSLLAAAELTNGICEYEYSSRLAEELADPDVYAIINVGIQRQFKSGYALILWENCARFRRTGSTGWWTLDLFRKLLGATVPTYDDFRRLSELVINKAVKEVNAVSDIRIAAEYERKGRKVTRIRFTVAENQQQTLFSDNERVVEEAKETETFKRLRNHGIGEKLAIAWVLTDEQRAKSALNITEQRARGGHIKASPAGYVRRLMEDVSIDLEGHAFEKQGIVQGQEKREATEKAALQQQMTEAAKEARREKVKSLVKALSTEELKEYASVYIAGDGTGQSKSYNASKGSFKDVVERLHFMTWLRMQISVKHGLAEEMT